MKSRTNRRRLLVAVAGAIVLCLPLTRFQPVHPVAARAKRPNILIIVTDDQRGGLQVMPATRRAFISQGRRFPSAFATTPYCCPSRASIMTGKYEHNHGVLDNRSSKDLDQGTTIQRYLEDAGYRSGIFGKYLNNWRIEIAPPHFDDWAVMNTSGKNSRQYRGAIWNVAGRLETVPLYSTKYIGYKTIQFLRKSNKQDSQPWFAYVATHAPHAPFTAEKKYADAHVPLWHPGPNVFELDRSDKPPFGGGNRIRVKKGTEIRKAQLRTLMSVDELVEDVLTALKSLREKRDTLIFFISDNGYMWGEHGWFEKQKPYAEAVQVPMFVRWPDAMRGGSVDSRLVGNIDIAPTILDAVGLPQDPNSPMDGRSLLDGSWDRDRILLESNTGRQITHWASTWQGDRQYTEFYDDTGVETFHEYYDLVADPWQMDNMLGDSSPQNDPPDALALKAQLELDKHCSGNDCP